MANQTSNLNLESSNGIFSRLRTGVETKTGKVILAATLFGLGSSALAGCAENVSANPEPSVSHSETVKEKTIDQKIQEKIAERPKEGTPEYEAIFAPMIIPYVEGQPPEEVVQELHNVLLLWTEAGYSDAPQTISDLNQWQTDTRKSVRDLTTELDLGYYDKGAADVILGVGWEDTEYGQRAQSELATLHGNQVSNMIVGVSLPKSIETVTDPGIQSSSSTDITGHSTSTRTEVGNKQDKGSEIVYRLNAIDSDGNGSLDRWQLVKLGY